MEINKCSESGCQAHCCSNVGFLTNKEEVQAKFPGALNLEDKEVGRRANNREPGVYYTEWGKYSQNVDVSIIGKCPNLGDNFNCKIYDSRPFQCELMELGGPMCTDIRTHHGLPPVKQGVIAFEEIADF